MHVLQLPCKSYYGLNQDMNCLKYSGFFMIRLVLCHFVLIK